MKIPVQSDWINTQVFTDANGDLINFESAFDSLKVIFLTATFDKIVEYEFEVDDEFSKISNGIAQVVWNHADNVDNYIGNVLIQYCFTVINTTWTQYSEPKLFIEVTTEKPNPVEVTP